VAVAGWTGGPVWHQAGTLPLVRAGRQAERLGVNLFVPAGPVRGTVLFVHGYMSHAANFAYTFAWFTARGWRVVTLDLPGHGLSTGPRADVDGFGEYGDAVAGWLDWVAIQSWPGPKVLVAHSLGTAACLEALRRPGTVRPDRVVFCAPLLKTAWYPVLSFGEASLGWWVKQVPSTFGWDGYLDGFVMPVHWFTALGQWLRAIETQRPLDLPLTIYAGDRDQVVDTGWNLAEYGRLVPGVREVVLPGKDHLFLSNREDREAFHRRLTADLGL
jgi:alpha-beta hydrolase superfamily lysophospholipase